MPGVWVPCGTSPAAPKGLFSQGFWLGLAGRAGEWRGRAGGVGLGARRCLARNVPCRAACAWVAGWLGGYIRMGECWAGRGRRGLPAPRCVAPGARSACCHTGMGAAGGGRWAGRQARTGALPHRGRAGQRLAGRAAVEPAGGPPCLADPGVAHPTGGGVKRYQVPPTNFCVAQGIAGVGSLRF